MGALIGIYGQALRDWYLRPKLVMDLELIEAELILNITNRGMKTAKNASVSIRYKHGGTHVAIIEENLSLNPKTLFRIDAGNISGDCISFDDEDIKAPLEILIVCSAEDMETKRELYYVEFIDCMVLQRKNISDNEINQFIGRGQRI